MFLRNIIHLLEILIDFQLRDIDKISLSINVHGIYRYLMFTMCKRLVLHKYNGLNVMNVFSDIPKFILCGR